MGSMMLRNIEEMLVIIIIAMGSAYMSNYT